MKFPTYEAAKSWAHKHAHEWCMPFHFWRVEAAGNDYVVAVRSKNNRALCAICF